MELELWADLSQAICDVQRRVKTRPNDTYLTALIFRVHLWSVLHDRPTRWGDRRLRSFAVQPADQCRTSIQSDGQLRRRADGITAMGSTDLARAELGLGQTPDQRLPNPLKQEKRG
jgi:hypothetical protein